MCGGKARKKGRVFFFCFLFFSKTGYRFAKLRAVKRGGTDLLVGLMSLPQVSEPLFETTMSVCSLSGCTLSQLPIRLVHIEIS